MNKANLTLDIKSLPSKKILIMDDEEIITTLISRILGLANWEFEVTFDGSQAIDAVKRKAQNQDSFDIVLLDLHIRNGMGGLESIVIIKQLQPSIRSILMSGSHVDDAMLNYRKYGFDGILRKPFTIQQFATELHRIIQLC